MKTFYLGTHNARWLADSPVPLMISFRTLNRYRRRGDDYPKATSQYAIDSGAYSEITRHGEWTIDADTYGGAIYRIIDDLGRPPDFVGIQDFMTEDEALAATGLTEDQHQQYTLESYLYLTENFPHAPWLPTLQARTIHGYLRHLQMYADAGIDLTQHHLVGLGSVCRLQKTNAINTITDVLHHHGLKLHAYGLKRTGLRHSTTKVHSVDSFAWSDQARLEEIRLPHCQHRGPCNNCRTWAHQWLTDTLNLAHLAEQQPQQLTLNLL